MDLVIGLAIALGLYTAFSIGANDVANAVPGWLLLVGGAGIVVGLATLGYRVMLTIGEKITELTPTRGYAAEFATATTIVIASRFGLPVSTTHTLVGAVLGVGLARGDQRARLSGDRNHRFWRGW